MQMRHLRYFVAAAEAGSFLKAASRLRVAQPSLSRLMRDLEREVGVTLFDRLPRGVRLTTAGEVFLHEARGSLEAAARAVATARREGATDRVLRIAHDPLFQYARLASRLLARFRQTYTASHVIVRRMSEVAQRRALRERRIDVAIDFIAASELEGLATYHLVDANITGVILPAGHPVAHVDAVSLRDLADLVWLRVSPKTSPEFYRTIRAALLGRGLAPARERTRPRDSTIGAMYVAAGDAWMLASDEIGRMYTEGNPAIVFRPFVEPPIPCWVALLYPRHAPSQNVLRLIEIARARP
jgi:DNA-binding transcriptional LysR family regulator